MSEVQHTPQQTTKRKDLFAPGKVFLFGEWSVLEGAPALVAPVTAGQRGTLECAPITSDGPRFTYAAPSLGMRERTWVWSRSSGWVARPEEAVDTGAMDLVSEVLTEVHRLGLEPCSSGALEVTPEGLFAEPDAQGHRAKFGFGSSGSTCALVSRAVMEMCGQAEEGRARVFSVALNAHRRAQGGRGSGADVAVSVWNDLVTVRLGNAPGLGAWEVETLAPRVAVENARDDVEILAVWTGREANTRTLMSAVQAFRDADPRGYGVCVRSLADAAMAGVGAWRYGEASDVLDATRAAYEALEELGQSARVEIVTQEHRTLCERVAHMYGGDVAVKPSGAGGGDVALLIARAGVLDRAAWNAETQRPSWWICRGASGA